VGGGWCELSKFLRDHFAHLLEEIPEVPSMGTKDVKWISSLTLNGNKDGENSSEPLNLSATRPPMTPEPKFPLPAVLLHTPSGTSPRSVHSSGSPGSPLAPLQFIRKAEESPIRSSTPSRLSKSTSARTPSRVVSSSAKHPLWRL
jgi:hypothetical protein